MGYRLEDDWKMSADDGASSPIGIELFPRRLEDQDLLHAWSFECGRSIEMGVWLEQSRRFIDRLVQEDKLSREDRKQAKTLLSAILKTLRDVDLDQT